MIDTKALRSRILDLAIQGKLTEQLPSDGTVEELYKQIQAEKQKLIKEEKVTFKPIEEISNDTLFELPKSWKYVRFGDVAYIVRGGSPRPIKAYITDSADGINWIKIGDVEKGGKYIYSTNEKIKPEGEKKSRRVYPGDFLLTNSMSFGRPYISKIEGCIHDGWLLIRNLNGFDVDFLYHILSSAYLSSQFKDKASGSTVENLNIDKVNSAIIPLPPLAEQKRIVERVEEIFRLLDTIDKAQEKYSADSQILKAKLITAGIQGKLTKQLPSDGTAEELYQQIQAEKQKLIKEGKLKKEKPLPPVSPEEVPFEIPENWMWVRLVDITTKITSGSTPPGGKKGNSYVPQGFCFFREQNIYNDGIHHDGMVYISEELLNTRENSTVLPNDILLNITGGSIGRCAIIPDDFSKGSINQHILIIRLVEKEMINYIHDLLCSPYYQGIIKSKVVGDKDGFSGGRCKATLIPLPPLAEQKRIADVLEMALGAIG